MGQLKILLIGANGFVGSNILQNFQSKYSVQTITRADAIDFSKLDSIKNLLEQSRPSIVINCLTYGAKQVSQGPSVEVANNTAMFYNFLMCKDLFDLYINIGSGAEFDRFQDVNSVKEHDLNYVIPQDSYGFAKNLIARSIQTVQDKFYRLLPRFLGSSSEFILEDRYFDYISATDFVKIVEFAILHRPQVHDINCVYYDKYKLSDFLNLFCKVQNIKKNFTISKQSQINYTGNGSRLNYIKNLIKLQGLEQGLRDYL
jgi:hypothetical protein